MDIYIHAGGKMQFIYQDELAPMLALGKSSTKRASHVEPRGDQWTADMSPVGGEVLGPYRLRSEALAAEVQWLRERMGEPLTGKGVR